MWSKETIKVALRSKSFLVGAVATVSASVGATLGYLVADRRLDAKYAALTEEEVAEAKRFYAQLHKTGEYSDPEAILTHDPEEETAPVIPPAERAWGEEMVRTLKYHTMQSDATEVPEEDLEPKVEEVAEALEEAAEKVRTVFEDEPMPFDYESEVENRTPDRAYIITLEEFNANEQDFEQVSMTYFEGDDTLCDAKDDPIPDVAGVVGGVANLSFGYGSEDANLVYIRNEKLRMDICVALSKGKYVVEVLNLDDPDELRHSDGGHRKFRDRRANG